MATLLILPKFIEDLAKNSILYNHPQLGITTDFESVRGLIKDDFILFNEVAPEIIYVHTIWDCRQNPDDLIIV